MILKNSRCPSAAQPIISVTILFLIAGFADCQERVSSPSRLVVAVRHVPPFAFRNNDGQWTGISVDLVREVKADLDHAAGHETELEFRELTLQAMLDAVQKGDVDLAAAALTVNFEREKNMDFTHAFHSSGLGIAVSGKEVRGWAGVVAAILSGTFLKVVIGLFAVLLASGVAVYFFERQQNTQFSGGLTKGVASGIWWAAVTMTTVCFAMKRVSIFQVRFTYCR